MTRRNDRYFEAFHVVLEGQLYQFGWIGEWREAFKHYGVTAVIDLEGYIPKSFPPLSALFSRPILPVLPCVPSAWLIPRLAATLIGEGERVAIACLAGEQRSLWMAGLVLWEMGLGDGKQILDILHNANPDGPGEPFSEHILSLKKKEPPPIT
jgi:hypothetical protein